MPRKSKTYRCYILAGYNTAGYNTADLKWKNKKQSEYYYVSGANPEDARALVKQLYLDDYMATLPQTWRPDPESRPLPVRLIRITVKAVPEDQAMAARGMPALFDMTAYEKKPEKEEYQD